MSDNITFHNYGDSHGPQIGKAERDVNISTPRYEQPSEPSLADHLTALRRALDEAHAQSQVDDGTYADAQQALDEAAQLTEPTTRNRRTPSSAPCASSRAWWKT